MLEKLGLGTVQFGQVYGVSNRHGQVPGKEAAAIVIAGEGGEECRLLSRTVRAGGWFP